MLLFYYHLTAATSATTPSMHHYQRDDRPIILTDENDNPILTIPFSIKHLFPVIKDVLEREEAIDFTSSF